MVRNLKFFFALVILLQTLIWGMANAQTPGPPKDSEKMAEEHSQRMKKDLGLTDDQATKIKAAMIERHKTMEANRNASEEQRRAAAERADKAFQEKAKTILSQEQFVKFKAKEEERRKKGRPDGPPDK